jgi:LytS/YehU family sensor histidine kinase
MHIDVVFFRKAGRLILTNMLLTFAILAFICFNCFFDWNSFIRSASYSFFLCLVLGSGNGFLIRKLDKRISWIETPAKRLVIGALILIGYSSVASFLIVFIFHFFIFKTISYTNFNWPSFIAAVTVPVYIAIIITVTVTSWYFLMAWRQAAVNAEKLKRENLQAQYDALKSQVNPHFLFNSFNVLTDLVYVDQDLAAQFIGQLSKVFRYVLESSKKELVPLTTELQFLQSYVFLLNIRFGENLKVKWADFPEQGAYIVPLSLQMLVENAIKHNVVSSEEPLAIEVAFEDGSVKVSNNLQRRNMVESSTGLGLANIIARYEHLSGKQVIVEENSRQFIVKIPLILS